MQENINKIKKMLKSDFKKSGWDNILIPFFDSKAFDDITDSLLDLVLRDRRFTPKFKDVFKPFKETNMSDLKVVIINQDPYPQLGVADGLAFSCPMEDEMQKSLQYIFTEIHGSYEGYNSDLTRWANQGVLLINTSFTCEINKMGSHTEIWKKFVEYVFQEINELNKDIVFVLMGRKTEYWQLRLPGQNILKCSHPASARYNDDIWDADNIFTRVNDELKKQDKDQIEW
jgi:uracil-DNA glycosylase